jgi:CHAT domain-containing protein
MSRAAVSGLLIAILLMAGCAVPPPSAYVNGDSAGQSAGLSVGKNAAGEDCTLQKASQGSAEIANVFCGTWQQPSGVVRSAGPVPSADLVALATSSPWREALEQRFACEAPKLTTILDGVPAALLSCTRRQGGWPHVALIAAAGGGASGHDVWYADGVLPALAPIERAVGLQSGRLQAGASVASSAADALMAIRLAAEAYSSGDIGKYYALMMVGSRANQAERFAAAERAFRAALALQEKALGANNPNTATTLERLALQISNQGRYAEADSLFARAEPLAVKSDDPLASARLAHYQALNLLNENKTDAALVRLGKAETAYAARLPAAMLDAKPVPQVARGNFGGGLAEGAVISDPVINAALAGTIEVRRYRAVALRILGRGAEAEAVLQSARGLARGNNLREPVEIARLTRTAGAADLARGDEAQAATTFASAATLFGSALPQSRPLAETRMLEAAAIGSKAGLPAALIACQDAIAILRLEALGVLPKIVAPCLNIFGVAADADPTHRQALLATMFEAAQLAQGGITGNQIAQATARLAEGARNPKVAEAIRRRQDAGTNLTDLERARDARIQGVAAGGPVSDTADLDTKIAAARAALADADSALQAASPNYEQLVQEVVPASAVLALLHPGEAFVAVDLDDTGGWTFVLRDGVVSAARITTGQEGIAKLVQRVRAGVEPTTDVIPPFDIAAAYTLYQDVLGPVAAELDGAKSLVVAPTGPLLSVPFGVLLTGPASPDKLAEAPWLLKRMTIAHVPAAANFVSLRKVAGTSHASEPWFGFGDFHPVTLAQAQGSFPGASCSDSAQLFAGLPPLPFAIRELDAARQLLGGRKEDELLGSAFTAKAVMAAQLKNYRILHFATHALLPAELRCQSEAAIVTSDPPGATDASGALLTVSNVLGLSLDADVVILSACNSGGGGAASSGSGPAKVAGESLSGLARAFFYAGARSLMVTHWSVNDQTAAYLVAQTMQEVRGGAGIAEALRHAQLSLLGSATGSSAVLAHPFYWAPFALIGDGGVGRSKTADRASRESVAGL